MDDVRAAIAELADALACAGEFEATDRTFAARHDSDETLAQFLSSDLLWGGAGSIADQAGGTRRGEERARVEAALITLGRRQLELGISNPRTRTWVEAFESWASPET